MKELKIGVVAAAVLVAMSISASAGEKWYTLFNGKDLSGWKSNEETTGAFSITSEGELKVSGGRAHLFWMGTDVIPGVFKDFELQLKVKTTKGSNSGVFFHTKYQEAGWPKHGYEAQVNTTHKDKRKTGSIYAVADVLNDAPSTDGVWFDYGIKVQGKTITVTVDGKVVNEHTEPEALEGTVRCLSKGAIAIQGHDPKSVVFFKDIKIRALLVQ